MSEQSDAAQAAKKLDAVLRMLLSSVESYREACTAKGDDAPCEERILGIMRVQVRIMENLWQTIKQVVESYGASVLQPHLEYIFLPLRLILQSSDWTDSNKNPIRQSAAWKLTETAARVTECTTKLLGPLMPFKQSIICLSACTFSLPREKVESKGLDRGDDYILSVLQCIDALLESAYDQKSYEEEVCMAMEGHLVAHISFCCTMLLSPDSRKNNPDVQLQALHTLDTLMKVAPVEEMWQSYFPGLFAVLCGLLLSELRLAAAQATPKVSSSACRTLAKLLCVALPATKKQQSDPKHVWEQVQQMAITPGSNVDQPATSKFLQEVNSRLPAPLILLLNLLPTASSPKLRQASSDLCLSILVETRSIWEQEETSNVLQSATECCITLSRDKDERVVSAAKSTIEDYRRDSGRHDVDSAIGPRVLELIEELPALARSGRETEFRGKINLISGYLMLGGSLRSSLLSVADEIQTCLAVLFDVDFDSIQYAPRVETSDSWSVWQPDRCRFRFMTDEMATSARDMVHSLGVALGQKGASSYVDACVANVLEACIATTHALEGPRQVNWLHEWIGSIVLANEILIGAFEEAQSQSSTTDDKDVSDGIQKASKTGEGRQSRRRLKRLHSLAGAILPVITTAPLWTLPTVLDNLDPESDKASSIERLTITEVQDNKPEVPNHTVSASALKGNSAMVCSLIELVSEMVDLIGNDAESFLPVILFPLCEKASSQNHSQVQHTASLALHKVATACGLTSTRELIRQNFDYLFGAMLSRTRRSGGQQTRGNKTSFPVAIPSIVQVVLRSVLDVDATEHDRRLKRSRADETCVSYVIEVVNALVASFDNNLVILNKDPSLQASSALQLVEVFDSALLFIASTLGLSLELRNDASSDVSIPKEGVDWWTALEPFRLQESDFLPAKEGFEKIHNETNNGDETDGDENVTEDETNDEKSAASDRPSLQITNGELDFVSLAFDRCSFFLSSPSLHVEMATCIGMQHAFALLGDVAIYTTSNKDEANGPKTAVLRHISTSWPSIISRFRVLSSTVIAASSVRTVSIRSLHATATPVSTDASTQMIFLSKLFDLIGTMCEVSESFMVSRIKDQVWPITAKLLDMYVQHEKKNPHKQLSCDTLVSKDAIPKKTFVSEREKLLFSMLNFLTRIYRQEGCGEGLSGLIPAVGTILFPFLANEGELQTRTMRALKTMMLIDCDALWRPLLQLSHRPLLPNPFGGVLQSSVDVTVHDKTPLELAANELVEFVEALPEQPLVVSYE